MKLKNLYLFFIIALSFNIKAQSIEVDKPILANSQSLSNDSLQNKHQDDIPKLSVQESKLDNKAEQVIQPASLKVSEAIKTEATKSAIKPKNK